MMRSFAIGVVAALASVASAHAATIVLDSASNGTYTYGLLFGGGETVTFGGEAVTLTGLDGVTGASVTQALKDVFSVSTTPTSVTFSTIPPSFSYTNNMPAAELSDLFTITSTDTNVGLINFDVFSGGGFSGQVGGPVTTPVTATPEPASIALLSTGLLGVAGVLRRRLL